MTIENPYPVDEEIYTRILEDLIRADFSDLTPSHTPVYFILGGTTRSRQKFFRERC